MNKLITFGVEKKHTHTPPVLKCIFINIEAFLIPTVGLCEWNETLNAEENHRDVSSDLDLFGHTMVEKPLLSCSPFSRAGGDVISRETDAQL